MKDPNKIEWILELPIDSLQIYFPCSLELQEELITHGFNVPADKSGKIKTPIPLIYSNFRGWLKTPEPITSERLIPPEWYGKTPEELGWKPAIHKDKKGAKAYCLPKEEVYVRIGADEEKRIFFYFDIQRYHLERTSIRVMDPAKWRNWAMFYINIEELNKIVEALTSICQEKRQFYPVSENQQGGKERTYYASPIKGKSLGIPVVGYSLCLGCFDLSAIYLRNKAIENGLAPNIVEKLRLRIEYHPSIKAGMKIGIARIEGKEKQLMFKLCSETPIRIKGILKETIEGKARGKLCFCDHTTKHQMISVWAEDVLGAIETTKPYLNKL
ncbi:MAG: hypothetical protein QXX33_00485 [Candidatus Hadarchaeales archaeon]